MPVYFPRTLLLEENRLAERAAALRLVCARNDLFNRLAHKNTDRFISEHSLELTHRFPRVQAMESAHLTRSEMGRLNAPAVGARLPLC